MNTDQTASNQSDLGPYCLQYRSQNYTKFTPKFYHVSTHYDQTEH